MNIINANLPFRDGLSYGNNPKMIVLHHADAVSCSIEDIHRWHLENGWSGCGYHYFVRKDGTVYIGRDEKAVGAHCLNYNAVSIGICAEGNFNVEDIREAQYNALQQLIHSICNKYGINKICTHKELNITDCPGSNFHINRIKKDLGGGAAGSSYHGYLIMMNPNVKDENVRVVQSRLIDKGYSLVGYGADGYFGIATLEAVKGFQEDYGISVDGIVGANTWERLIGYR
ncbi:MAG: N-acetylmuramoyl-L-alanine amidase [Clostridiaceae bacterium]|nr:N-acetylmuramoyl-L-alanine amidase [Clostridiaceae bacterium]